MGSCERSESGSYRYRLYISIFGAFDSKVLSVHCAKTNMAHTIEKYNYSACCELAARGALKMCEEDLTYDGYEFYKVHEHPDQKYIELRPTFAPWHKNHVVYYFCWGPSSEMHSELPQMTQTPKGRRL